MNRIKSVTIGLIIIGTVIIYSEFQIDKEKQELKKFSEETVAKTISFSGSKSGKLIHYLFSLNNKDYQGSCLIKKSNAKLGCFYKLSYSSRDPKINKIYMDKEITDTTLIMKAGFKKYTKINKYDVNGNFLYTKDTLYFRR